VKSGSARSILPWIYGGSIAIHVAFAAVTLALPKQERTEAIAIELADIKKKSAPPKPPPPPPPPPPPQEKPKPPPPRPAAQAQAKIAPEPAKVEAAPAPLEVGADGFADLGGVALGGGGGGDGIALAAAAAPVGPSPVARAAVKTKATTRRVEELAPAAAETCHESVVRPKAKSTLHPEYTMKAREAEIEGDVVLEVTVDETGKVLSVRLVRGLGYGLDESAKAAAAKTLFEPAMLCGKPVIGTVKIRITFEGT
jgi:protein TonB